ncbi:MAG TPA: hypothetical protein VEI52_21915 [Terriglobales bacterium]|nr:hypothetical protein [Terriglobales bacterium]
MGTIKLAFGLFVIAAAIYLSIELVPVYYANYEFQDVIKTEATLQTYTTKPEAEIQATIYKKAQQLELPLMQDQIQVQRRGNLGTGSLTIRAPYTVRVDLPGYPLDLHFEASTENKSPF